MRTIKYRIFICIVSLFLCFWFLCFCTTLKIPEANKINYNFAIQNFLKNNFNNHFSIINEEGSILHPSVSANHFMAYTSNKEGSGDIWLRDLNTSYSFPIISHPSEQYKPSINGDASLLVYISETNGIEGDLMISEINSQNLIQSYYKGFKIKNHWDDSINLSLKIRNWAEANLSKECHGPASEKDPYLNYVGDKILYSSDRCHPGIFNVWLLELNKLEIRSLKKITTNGGVGASFSPDESEIVFLYRGVKNDEHDLYIIDCHKNNSINKIIYSSPQKKSILLSPIFIGDSNHLAYIRILEDSNNDGNMDEKDVGEIIKAKLENGKLFEERQLLEGDVSLYSISTRKINVKDNDSLQNFFSKKANSNTANILDGIFYTANINKNINIFYIPETGIVPIYKKIQEQYEFIQKYKGENTHRYILALENFLKTYLPRSNHYIKIKYEAQAFRDLSHEYVSSKSKNKNEDFFRTLKNYLDTNIFFEYFYYRDSLDKNINKKEIILNQILKQLQSNEYPRQINISAEERYQLSAYFLFEKAKLFQIKNNPQVVLELYESIWKNYPLFYENAELYLEYLKYNFSLINKKSPIALSYQKLLNQYQLKIFFEKENIVEIKKFLFLITSQVSKDQFFTYKDFENIHAGQGNEILLKILDLCYVLKLNSRKQFDLSLPILKRLIRFSENKILDAYQGNRITQIEELNFWHTYKYLCYISIRENLDNTSELSSSFVYLKEILGYFEKQNNLEDLDYSLFEVVKEKKIYQNLYQYYSNLIFKNKLAIDNILQQFQEKVKHTGDILNEFKEKNDRKNQSLFAYIVSKVKKEVKSELIYLSNSEYRMVEAICDNDFQRDTVEKIKEKLIEVENNKEFNKIKNNFCQEWDVFKVKTPNLHIQKVLTIDLTYSFNELLVLQNVFAMIQQNTLLSLNDRIAFQPKHILNTSLYSQRHAVDLILEVSDKLINFEILNSISNLLLGDRDVFNSKYFDILDNTYKLKMLSENPRIRMEYLYAQAYLLIHKNILREKLYTQKTIPNLYFGSNFLQNKKKEILNDFKHVEFNLKTIIAFEPYQIESHLLLIWLYQYIEETKKVKIAYTTPYFYFAFDGPQSYEKATSFYKDIYDEYFPENYHEINIELLKKNINRLELQNDNPKALCRLYLNFGNHQFILLNFSDAIESYRKVLSFSKQYNIYIFENTTQEKLFYFNYGRALMNDYDYKGAIPYINEAYLYYRKDHLEIKQKLENLNNEIVPRKRQIEYWTNELEKSRVRLAMINALMGLASWLAEESKQAIVYYEKADYHLNEEGPPISGGLKRSHVLNFLSLAYQAEGNFNASNINAKKSEKIITERRNLVRPSSRYKIQNPCLRVVGCFVNFGEDFSVIGPGRNPYGFEPVRSYELSLSIQFQNSLLEGNLKEAYYLLQTQRDVYKNFDLDVQHGKEGYINNFNQYAYREFEKGNYLFASSIFQEASDFAFNFENTYSYLNNTINMLQSKLYYLESLKNIRNKEEIFSICEKSLDGLENFYKKYRKLLKNNFIKKRKTEFSGFRFNEERDGFLLEEQAKIDLLPIEVLNVGISYIYVQALKDKNQNLSKINFLNKKIEENLLSCINVIQKINFHDEKTPLLVHTYLNLGRIYKDQGYLHKARQILEKAIEETLEARNLVTEEMLAHFLLYEINFELYNNFKDVEFKKQAFEHASLGQKIYVKFSYLYQHWERFIPEILSILVDYNVEINNEGVALKLLEYNWRLYLEEQYFKHPLGFKDVKIFNKELYNSIRNERLYLIQNELSLTNSSKKKSPINDSSEIKKLKERNYSKLKNTYSQENPTHKIFLAPSHFNVLNTQPKLEDGQLLLRIYKSKTNVYCWNFQSRSRAFYKIILPVEEWDLWNKDLNNPNKDFEIEKYPKYNHFILGCIGNPKIEHTKIQDFFLITDTETFSDRLPYYFKEVYKKYSQSNIIKDLPLPVFSTRLDDDFIGYSSSYSKIRQGSSKYNIFPLLQNSNPKLKVSHHNEALSHIWDSEILNDLSYDKNDKKSSAYKILNRSLSKSILEIKNLGLELIWQASQVYTKEVDTKPNTIDDFYKKYKSKNNILNIDVKEITFNNETLNKILYKKINPSLCFLQLKKNEILKYSNIGLLYEVLRANEVLSLLVYKENSYSDEIDIEKIESLAKSPAIYFGYPGYSFKNTNQLKEEEESVYYAHYSNAKTLKLEKDYYDAKNKLERACALSLNLYDGTMTSEKKILYCIIELNKYILFENSSKLNSPEIDTIIEIVNQEKNSDLFYSFYADIFDVLSEKKEYQLADTFYIKSIKNDYSLEKKLALIKLKFDLKQVKFVHDLDKRIEPYIEVLKSKPDLELFENLIKHHYHHIAFTLYESWQKNTPDFFEKTDKKKNKEFLSYIQTSSFFTNQNSFFSLLKKKNSTDMPQPFSIEEVRKRHSKLVNNHLVTLLSKEEETFNFLYFNITKNISQKQIEEIKFFIENIAQNISEEYSTWMALSLSHKFLLLEEYSHSLYFFQNFLNRIPEEDFKKSIKIFNKDEREKVVFLTHVLKNIFYKEIKSDVDKIKSFFSASGVDVEKIIKKYSASHPMLMFLLEMELAYENNNVRDFLELYLKKNALVYQQKLPNDFISMLQKKINSSTTSTLSKVNNEQILAGLFHYRNRMFQFDIDKNSIHLTLYMSDANEIKKVEGAILEYKKSIGKFEENFRIQSELSDFYSKFISALHTERYNTVYLYLPNLHFYSPIPTYIYNYNKIKMIDTTHRSRDRDESLLNKKFLYNSPKIYYLSNFYTLLRPLEEIKEIKDIKHTNQTVQVSQQGQRLSSKFIESSIESFKPEIQSIYEMEKFALEKYRLNHPNEKTLENTSYQILHLWEPIYSDNFALLKNLPNNVRHVYITSNFSLLQEKNFSQISFEEEDKNIEEMFDNISKSSSSSFLLFLQAPLKISQALFTKEFYKSLEKKENNTTTKSIFEESIWEAMDAMEAKNISTPIRVITNTLVP